jgi:hypothetical protein
MYMSLTNNLKTYKEIAQDYLNYLDQHADNSSDLKKTAPLSSWRNTFTGVFYNGKYAASIIWDILAGEVTSEHANFIVLINRIVKVDRDPEGILRNIISSNEKSVLLGHLFDYFMSIQTNTINKNASYYASMKALKRDINHFAKECSISQRIGKHLPDNAAHYEYKIQENLSSEKNDKKGRDHRFKKMWNKIAKYMASGMAFTEIFIALSGLAAIPFVAPVGLLILLKVLVSASAVFFGYIFAKNELLELGKQIYLGRIFQIKNLRTGEYESLKGYQKFLIVLLSPFSLVAGCCIGTLAFTSAFAAIGGMAMIPVISAVSLFVFCLSAATYFLTIKNVISHIDEAKLTEYMNSLKRKNEQSRGSYALHIGLEIGKWIISLAVMSTVAVGGYYLFKDKAISALGKVWSGLAVIQAEKIASWISAAYSAIKLVFGTSKIMQLLPSAAEAVGYYAKAIIGFFIPEMGKPKPKPKLNPIQQQNQDSQASYTTTAKFFLMLRALVTSGFYHEAAKSHHFSSPTSIAGTAGGFVYAINADPLKKSEEKQAETPLDCKKPAP